MQKGKVRLRAGAPAALAIVALASLNVFPEQAMAAPPASDPLAGLAIDIPATKTVLANGLTLIVHEDHSTPLVSVNITYHVGSKDEPAGKSGFAHLFEHLMFNGSENFNDDFFKATQAIGATEQNGTTSWDRTNYYQTVPTAALDSILWLESDRMGHLLGALTQARLDEQRAVVKNEKREGENAPYAVAEDLVIRALTPAGHPYAHSIIGSMADLDAAGLDDVKAWFRKYYGPGNATIVLSGNVNSAEARAKVERYFGDIAPGSPVAHPQSWTLKREGTVREIAYDRVAQTKVFRAWNVSDYASQDTDALQLVAAILAGDKTARLYKRLVLEEQLATSVEVGLDNREIGGVFMIKVLVRPDADAARVEAVLDEELAKLIASGPSAAEVARVRLNAIVTFARALESNTQKAAMLAESQTYLGTADGWKRTIERYRGATPAVLQNAARLWLNSGDYRLQIRPFGAPVATATGSDRRSMPLPGLQAPAMFPSVERATLANGLKLVVARRAGTPMVNFTMLVPTGTPADFAQILPGTGPLAINLLDEATTTRTGGELAEELARLGAELSVQGGGETSYASLVVLKSALKPSLKLFADVIMHPAFAQPDLERLRAQSVARLAAIRQDPDQSAQRLIPHFIFGDGSAYGRLTSEATLKAIDRAQVEAFHRCWFIPNNSTLIVTGDVALADIRPVVETSFAAWKQGEQVPTIRPTEPGPERSIVYLVDKPETPQSVILAAVVAPPRGQDSEVTREVVNTALGGTFTSRLNMRLREEKGWAYGASSRFGRTRGSRLFLASASVQSDKTAESISEMAGILTGIASDLPLSPDEVANAKAVMTLGLSSEWSTAQGLSNYLFDESLGDLPAGFYASYPAKIDTVSPADANAAAGSLLAGKPLTWVVVGDRAKIEAKIRALKLGEVRIVDADGNPVP